MVLEVSLDEYGKYIHYFEKERFPKTWIESAFKFKTAKLLVDEAISPAIVALLYPYHAFITGEPNSAKLSEILDAIPEETEMNVDEDKWLSKLKSHFGQTLLQKTRIKMSHESLSLDKLELLKKPLPTGYTIERVDKETAEKLPDILQVHIPPYFGSVDNFIENGIGFCVKHDDEAISMAGSCIPYTNVLEVQIATVDSLEYRRRGFGTAACIALLEYCLSNGI